MNKPRNVFENILVEGRQIRPVSLVIALLGESVTPTNL